MPAQKQTTTIKKTAATVSADGFMKQLEHPHKAGFNRLRKLIKGIDPRIVEEIKWKAPSFKLDEHFATLKLYPPTQIQIILHRGAKVKKDNKEFTLPDPHGIVQWPAPDRCVISLGNNKQARVLEPDVETLIRLWIQQL